MFKAALQRLEQLLVAAKERGNLFVIFEDLHWADGPSLDLLVAVLRDLVDLPTAFLLTLREDAPGQFSEPETSAAIGRFQAALEEGQLATRFALAPLTLRHVQELARSVGAGLPFKKLTDARKKWVWEVSEGNPQVAIECLLALAQMPSGEKPDSFLLPSPLQQRLAARMALLPEAARGLLVPAALVGREAEIDLLSAACDLTGAALADALEALEAAKLVEIAGNKLAFRWNRYRFAAANSALPQRQQVTHEALRDALLGLYPDQQLRFAEELALHSRGAKAPGWRHCGSMSLRHSAPFARAR